MSMGNPDPELFSIPRQYALVSPVEFEARWKEKFKGRSYLGEEQGAPTRGPVPTIYSKYSSMIWAILPLAFPSPYGL